MKKNKKQKLVLTQESIRTLTPDGMELVRGAGLCSSNMTKCVSCATGTGC